MRAVKELIDEMVNHELMTFHGENPDANIMFASTTHQRFFNIMLVDFLSKTDKRGPIKQTSYLSGLVSISNNPRFNVNGSVSALKKATIEFKKWLENVVEVEIWLPSTNKEAMIKLSRYSFLKIVGDISKHNYLRAAGVAEDIRKVFAKNEIIVNEEESLLMLSDFYERFHTDILNYHSSTIAEYLNNIRWGIYEYLRPEFESSIVWDKIEPGRYRYTYPNEINSDLGKTIYWDLMNEIRQEPYVHKFIVTKWLKMRY